jgi:AcrR family transcriptional regulator
LTKDVVPVNIKTVGRYLQRRLVIVTKKYNPQQTIENILSVSEALFAQRGYEKTSMQDIVDALGMSKGAIFHHFKSKQDIFDAVAARLSIYANQALLGRLEEMQGLSAKEKLIGLLEQNQRDKQIHVLDNAFESQMQSPQFVVAFLKDCVNARGPVFAKIMREGLEDGSIQTDYPDECAEIFFLLINVWCDQSLFQSDRSQLCRRLKFLQQLMKRMGADILSDELITEYMQSMNKNDKEVAGI